MSKPVPQILRDAADHIETVGWHQGSYISNLPNVFGGPIERRPCCALGAIRIASGYYRTEPLQSPVVAGTIYTLGYSDEHRGDVEKAEAALSRFLGTPPYSIPEWNDSPFREKDHVTHALRRAAEIEEARA